jgi:hypothetical protein
MLQPIVLTRFVSASVVLFAREVAPAHAEAHAACGGTPGTGI